MYTWNIHNSNFTHKKTGVILTEFPVQNYLNFGSYDVLVIDRNLLQDGSVEHKKQYTRIEWSQDSMFLLWKLKGEVSEIEHIVFMITLW